MSQEVKANTEQVAVKTESAEKPLTKNELELALEKQRLEAENERKKREELEKELERKLAELSKSVTDVQKTKLDAPKPDREPDPTPKDGERYLKFLEEKQSAAVAEIAKKARLLEEKQAKEIEALKADLRKKELAMYRKAALVDVPAALHDIVVGDSEDAIDKAKAKAKELEKSLRDQLKSEVAKEAEKSLPKSRNPAPASVTATNRPKTAQDLRKQIASDPKAFNKDFEARRDQLLKEKFGL